MINARQWSTQTRQLRLKEMLSHLKVKGSNDKSSWQRKWGRNFQKEHFRPIHPIDEMQYFPLNPPLETFKALETWMTISALLWDNWDNNVSKITRKKNTKTYKQIMFPHVSNQRASEQSSDWSLTFWYMLIYVYADLNWMDSWIGWTQTSLSPNTTILLWLKWWRNYL